MKNATNSNPSLIRIVLKAIILFLIINYSFIVLINIPLGKLSIYNHFVAGRDRLPFGENVVDSYNMTIADIDGMIASHKISRQKKSSDEFRIIILGDSSVWGFLQSNKNTLFGLLNQKIDYFCKGKKIRVFNLGYPSLSILKDLIILEKIRKYEPDMVIWLITLESLIRHEQGLTPLVAQNPQVRNRVIEKYDIDIDEVEINLLDFTLINQRRRLADLFRLQLLGVMWSATEIDQDLRNDYTPAQRDFEKDDSYKNFKVGNLKNEDMALEILLNPPRVINETEFVMINEPILISNGRNSDLRYNFYYPRWAYDAYRKIIEVAMNESRIKYYDLWDIVPESEFTNSAIHLSQNGEQTLANKVYQIIEDYCQNE